MRGGCLLPWSVFQGIVFCIVAWGVSPEWTQPCQRFREPITQRASPQSSEIKRAKQPAIGPARQGAKWTGLAWEVVTTCRTMPKGICCYSLPLTSVAHRHASGHQGEDIPQHLGHGPTYGAHHVHHGIGPDAGAGDGRLHRVSRGQFPVGKRVARKSDASGSSLLELQSPSGI